MTHGLYLAYELGYASLAPWRQAWLTSVRMAEALSSPLSPLPPPLRHACRTWEMLAALQVRGQRPPFGLNEDDAQEEVVCELPFCSLLRFCKHAAAPRILLVAPLSGHFASRMRDTVRTLIEHYDVFVTDWHNARDVPLSYGRFDLDDYIEYLQHFLRRIGPGAHMVAVCQACPAALAATALLAEDEDPARPRSLTLMCGPIDPRLNPTVIDLYAMSMPTAWFERCMTTLVPAGFAGAGRRVAPGFLQMPSLSWTESSARLSSLLRTCASMEPVAADRIEQARKSYEDELSLLDLSAEFYLSTIERVFRNPTLPTGRMRWRGRQVRPGAIRDCGLMTVEATEDDVCGAGQTHAAHPLCNALPSSLRWRLTEASGHVALFSGPAWHAEVLPALRAMITQCERERHAGTEAESGPPRPDAPGRDLPVLAQIG